VENLADLNLPRWLAVFQGMGTWPDVRPEEMTCPTLLVVGSESEAYQTLIADQMDVIQNAGIRVQVFDGLTPLEEFTEIELVLPVVQAFLSED